MKKIEVSKEKSSADIMQMIRESKENCVLVFGEDESVLAKEHDSEWVNKFNIGDKVQIDKDVMAFNGIDKCEFEVVGFEKFNNQYVYTISSKDYTFNLFGYELEKI